MFHFIKTTGIAAGLSKKDITESATKDTDDLLERGGDPIKEYVILKKIADYVGQAIKRIEPAAIDEYEKYGEKSVRFNSNTEIIFREGHDVYDYSEDQLVCELTDQLALRKKELKMIALSSVERYDQDGVQIYGAKVKNATKSSLVIKY